MKSSRFQNIRKFHAIPELRFENQNLTSFSGLVLFQALFQKLDLKDRLRQCFVNHHGNKIFGSHLAFFWLILHLLMGFRQFREKSYYENDPLVCRLLGVNDLPNVSTLSRSLSGADDASCEKTKAVNEKIVVDRMAQSCPARATLDFDGSVLSTKRKAQGSAVGFNKKKKGARSYYPLLCSVAQTGQFFQFYHRPGNVHDSNGSEDFIRYCCESIRERIPRIKLEARMDSAFFNDTCLEMLNDEQNVEFTATVPFERFPELKEQIEKRKKWKRLNEDDSYFECQWKPKSWNQKYRFIFVRQKVKNQTKGPLQLDFFIPVNSHYEYQVIVTNKKVNARKVIHFHHGRGSQENFIGEAKQETQLDYIPMKTLVGNRLFCSASVLAHNLSKEIQMQVQQKERGTTEKRNTHWVFQKLSTLRRTLIQRAGRLIWPQGKLTLAMQANEATQDQIEQYLAALSSAAAA